MLLLAHLQLREDKDINAVLDTPRPLREPVARAKSAALSKIPARRTLN
jgi:hypothetical protein